MIIALQVETASCIENIDEIAAVPGVDILFLGQNDLCMSMGLYEKYEFPHMYTSPELQAATEKLRAAAKRNNVIPSGYSLFGTARVGEFLEKDFNLYQHWQRSAPRPHASGCVCEGHGNHCQGQREDVGPPAFGADLKRAVRSRQLY